MTPQENVIKEVLNQGNPLHVNKLHLLIQRYTYASTDKL